MKRSALVIVLVAGAIISGCATSSRLLAEIEEAPKWFLDKIPEAEAAGYPTLAATPPIPDDLPKLSSWEVKLQKLKAEGERVVNETRAHEQEKSHLVTTGEFLRSSLNRADVEKFNADEAAAEDATEAKP